MIRTALLWMYVGAVGAYAWRDWYRALCGLILLMAVIEHPDMPKSIGGVQGLNPWNILFADVVLAWLVARPREGLRLDAPRAVGWLLFLYAAVVVVGFARMMADPRGLAGATTESLVSEQLINTLKWTVPALLLFDGCRTRERFRLGAVALLGVYLLLAIQVARWVPPQYALDVETLTARSRSILRKEVGYHAVTLSMMLAGTSWAILAARPLFESRAARAAVALAALVAAYAQAMTAGRMGYATWAVVGLLLCLVRWRRLLWLIPAVALAIALLAPGVVGRTLRGFEAGETLSFEEGPGPDPYVVTSGRTLIWPYVVGEIAAAPLAGHGRLAMQRTGLSRFLLEELGESFPHPHNAYLEWLLDNGILGAALILPFYVLVTAGAIRLFRRGRTPEEQAAGGIAAALVLALLVAGVGSQTFYPREEAVSLWCSMGLLLRAWVERLRGDPWTA